MAATLVHALPDLCLRLRYEGRTLLEVVREPGGTSRTGRVTPCAFRGAVAQAHRRLENGDRLRFLDLPEVCTPKVDIGMSAGGCVYPSGIYRVALDSGQTFGFATTVPAGTCQTVLAAHHPRSSGVRLHHDAATDVTVMHLTLSADEPAVVATSILEDLVAACLAEEVGCELAREAQARR